MRKERERELGENNIVIEFVDIRDMAYYKEEDL